jgi:hypothetical protein
MLSSATNGPGPAGATPTGGDGSGEIVVPPNARLLPWNVLVSREPTLREQRVLRARTSPFVLYTLGERRAFAAFERARFIAARGAAGSGSHLHAGVKGTRALSKQGQGSNANPAAAMVNAPIPYEPVAAARAIAAMMAGSPVVTMPDGTEAKMPTADFEALAKLTPAQVALRMQRPTALDSRRVPFSFHRSDGAESLSNGAGGRRPRVGRMNATGKVFSTNNSNAVLYDATGAPRLICGMPDASTGVGVRLLSRERCPEKRHAERPSGCDAAIAARCRGGQAGHHDGHVTRQPPSTPANERGRPRREREPSLRERLSPWPPQLERAVRRTVAWAGDRRTREQTARWKPPPHDRCVRRLGEGVHGRPPHVPAASPTRRQHLLRRCAVAFPDAALGQQAERCPYCCRDG